MTQLLERINSPADLKRLSLGELNQLAKEIRTVLIETVAKNGGHLAPNLGVVELTLALHLVFDSPRDRLIWDVGHQSYIHKLLTGRRETFSTLRQYQGLSGFPKQRESEHDVFETGHSSTSISAAVGMALARDLKREKHHVVAIIGDGALTGGMAFEALNYAGHLHTNLIVVLNDNEMSIASNVGALSSYLTKMRTDPMYFKGKEEVESLLRRIPAIGPTMVKLAEKLKDTLKYLVVPGMIFEELGFTYLGPIDGHNLASMKSVLQNAKATSGPVLIHVLTKKGKGYPPAETNPDKFHGIGPFDVGTGQSIKKNAPPTYTQVFGETLIRLARDDERLLAVTAAMPDGTGLNGFARQFPQRFFDVGIAEQHAVTMSAGLARDGFRPVVAIYSTFLQRAYDQVLHDVCLQKLPVVFAIDRAGLVGEDGATHQGLFDLAYLRHIPNMVVMAPKDENELQHMLKTAVGYDGPIAIRYPRGTGVGVQLEEKLRNLPIGQAELLCDGTDITILAVGPLVYTALEAANRLREQGVKVAVVNVRFIKPLDEELILRLARQTKHLVTLEEHVLAGGFGSAVLELLARKQHSEVKVINLGIPDEFVEHGPIEVLRTQYGLTPEGIVATIRQQWPLRVGPWTKPRSPHWAKERADLHAIVAPAEGRK
ncbi:MAG: 1-deoxy-D-xylulose-5-phosphate synthase [Firmicutes bacterium]|nr:1-deoxy-D-xylulose-5-phosphate synthase [Bacillota bacterium]